MGVGRTYSLVIVDDHPIVREGLNMLLSRDPCFRVVGLAANVREARALVAERAPNAALLDVALGPESGLALAAELRAAYPEIVLLMLSMHDEALFAERSLAAGADGFVMKDQGTETILAALRRVLEGKTYVSDAASERLLRAFTQHRRRPEPEGVSVLSDREIEILRLIGQGTGTAKIAASLHLSPKTVETHRSRIKVKLGVSTVGELTVLAANWLRDGTLVSPPK